MNTNPLAPLRPRLEELIDAVLADWDDPTMTGARICARHEITPEQLEAIARLPRFRDTLARLDAIRELRRPHLEARARSDLFRSLSTIIYQDPTTASKAKEIRLAIKQLLPLIDGAGDNQPTGAGGILPPDRAKPDAPKPPVPPPSPSGGAGEVARRSRDGGGRSQTQVTAKPHTTPNHFPSQPPRTRPNKPTPAAALLAGVGAAPAVR